MAKYKITFPRREDIIEEERVRHPNWTPCLTNWYDFGIDDLIIVIEACERNGVMLRDILYDMHYTKEGITATELGKLVWEQKALTYISDMKRQLKETYDTQAKTVYTAIGDACLRSYKVAMNFNIGGANRNDDRYRYYCNFRVDDTPWFVEDIMIKDYYTDKMKDYIRRHYSMKCFLYIISKFDEYLFSDISSLFEFKNYIRNKVNSNIFNKIGKMSKYFELLEFMTRFKVSDIDRGRRVHRIIPIELYAAKLAEVRLLIQKIKEAWKFLDTLQETQDYIDEDEINFVAVSNMKELLYRINRNYENLLQRDYEQSDITKKCCKDLDIVGRIQNSVKVRIGYWDIFTDEEKPDKWLYGWFGGGTHYGQLLRASENRKKLFI